MIRSQSGAIEAKRKSRELRGKFESNLPNPLELKKYFRGFNS